MYNILILFFVIPSVANPKLKKVIHNLKKTILILNLFNKTLFINKKDFVFII